MACAALKSSIDAMVVTDSRGIIRIASDSMLRVLGWSPDELVGRSVGVLVPEDDRPAHEAALARYPGATSGAVVDRTRETAALRRDGARLPVELTVSRFRADDGEEMLSAVFRDITSQKRSREELESHQQDLECLVRERTKELERSHEKLRVADRLAAIGTLAAGLGHDMNNVLLPVRSRLNALLAPQPPARWREHVEAIRRSVVYLQQLADGLHYLALDPAREDARDTTDIAPWWNQASMLLRKAVPEHVRVIASIPESLPPVHMAPHRLTQAVLNLLVNAGEAIPPGRKRRQGIVRVTAALDAEQRCVHLRITDNGTGMSEEVRRRAFEMFFTTKPRGLGTGLGLPLVRRLIEDAGGRVEIESQEGRGASVLLVMPAAPARRPDNGGRWSAVITLGDARSASLVAQLLDSAGVRVSHGAEPGDANLWVAGPEDAARALDWRARRTLRQAVLVGAGQPGIAAPGCVTIDRTLDVNTIRAALGTALAELQRGRVDGDDSRPQ